MRILHVIQSMNPAAGGPVEGIKQLIIINRAASIEVVCLDEPDAPWLPDYKQLGITIHPIGKGYLKYGYSPHLVSWIKQHYQSFDSVIVNGIWQFHSFAAWLALKGTGKNYHVFIHGMLDPWFKYTFPLKHLKKWLYWPWAEYRVLRDATSVVFTCNEERILARESFWLYKVNEKVISYGVPFPAHAKDVSIAAFLQKFPQLKGRRYILFMGRINKKKGCDLLIRAFKDAAQADPELSLVIVGPDQYGWKSELTALASDMGISDKVYWPGMLTRELKWGAYYLAEAFCLPSHQENFGLVVAEALSCGLPVLISNKVNIWREIKECGAGIIEDDTVEGCRNMLLNWIGMNADAKKAMIDKTIPCFEENFHISKTLADLRAILKADTQ